jgi:glucosamine--fructose-6-phosphate aminotransferase (isomerizing)
MLSAALSGGEAFAELAGMPSTMRAAIELEDEVARVAGALASDDACVVLARGYQYATAREWALKLKEVAGLLADPYSGADFQHGPIALVEPGFPVLGVATTGPALEGELVLLGELRDRGARLTVLSDAPEVLGLAEVISLPSSPEWLSPLVAILPAQLFAYHLALARGMDPDAPRNLTKVTRTT